MAEIVYALCAFMSIMCAGLLFRAYRRSPSHLLLWGSLCFGILAMNNVILFVDVIILPEVEFNGGLWRSLTGAVAGSLLLFGLIWEMT